MLRCILVSELLSWREMKFSKTFAPSRSHSTHGEWRIILNPWLAFPFQWIIIMSVSCCFFLAFCFCCCWRHLLPHSIVAMAAILQHQFPYNYIYGVGCTDIWMPGRTHTCLWILCIFHTFVLHLIVLRLGVNTCLWHLHNVAQRCVWVIFIHALPLSALMVFAG